MEATLPDMVSRRMPRSPRAAGRHWSEPIAPTVRVKLTLRKGALDLDAVRRAVGEKTPLTPAQSDEFARAIAKLEAWIDADASHPQQFIDDPWGAQEEVSPLGPDLRSALACLRGGSRGGA